MKSPPPGAQYHIVKETLWLEDEEDDWLSDFDDGQDVYFKIVDNRLHVYTGLRNWTPVSQSLDDLKIYQREGRPGLKSVIPSQQIAEAVVKIAQVLRDSGFECHYNEDLNCLQHALIKEYFEEWRSQPIDAQYGAYQYWESIHKKLGIIRPGD